MYTSEKYGNPIEAILFINYWELYVEFVVGTNILFFFIDFARSIVQYNQFMQPIIDIGYGSLITP